MAMKFLLSGKFILQYNVKIFYIYLILLTNLFIFNHGVSRCFSRSNTVFAPCNSGL